MFCWRNCQCQYLAVVSFELVQFPREGKGQPVSVPGTDWEKTTGNISTLNNSSSKNLYFLFSVWGPLPHLCLVHSQSKDPLFYLPQIINLQFSPEVGSISPLAALWWEGIRESACILNRLSTNHPEFSTIFTLHLVP